MQGKVYNSQAQQLILNVFNFFTLEKLNKGPFIPETAVYDRACTALKISSSSLTKIIRKSQENPSARPSTPPLNRKKKGKGKVQNLDTQTKEAIRIILQEYVDNKQPVSVDEMHSVLKEKDLFPYSKTSMRLLIHELGYHFRRRNKQHYLFRKSEVVWITAVESDEYMESE